MRRADGLSSLRSSRRARSVYSIVQAKILSHFLRTERAFLALAHTLDHIGCEIVVLQFVEMGQDHLANVERLGAPGLFGQGVETAFNFFGKADGSGHVDTRILCIQCITRRRRSRNDHLRSILRAMKNTFAGRSPSRRMKYGYHSVPKGT